MSGQPAPATATKVVLYVMHRARLLVFLEPEFPHIELQVPGGTVESGEAIEAAAWRELAEETGLAATGALRPLGQQVYDFKFAGLDQVHTRHYFHLALSQEPPMLERWSHIENASSLGHGPITFALFWMDLDRAARQLGYGFGAKLPELHRALEGGAA